MSTQIISGIFRLVDALDARFHYSLGLGGVFWLREQAPDRIFFGVSG